MHEGIGTKGGSYAFFFPRTAYVPCAYILPPMWVLPVSFMRTTRVHQENALLHVALRAFLQATSKSYFLGVISLYVYVYVFFSSPNEQAVQSISRLPLSEGIPS